MTEIYHVSCLEPMVIELLRKTGKGAATCYYSLSEGPVHGRVEIFTFETAEQAKQFLERSYSQDALVVVAVIL